MNQLVAEAQFKQSAEKLLLGRRIKEVRYMTAEEAGELYWTKRPLVIILDNGSYLFPSADEEGNNGGALFVNQSDIVPSI